MKKDKVEMFDHMGNSRGFYSQENRLNDLTGKEWKFSTKSVIPKKYPTNLQHRLRSKHGGQKPPELCADLIRIFTKRGQSVLDPFAGVGGTLLGASLTERRAVGIELNPAWVEIYCEVCRLEGIKEQRLLIGDSRKKLPELEAEGLKFDFLFTDVPYWRMDRAQKSTGKFKRVGETSRENRPSKLGVFNQTVYHSKDHWLGELKEVFQSSLPLLKPKAYLAVFIGDMYNGGRYHFLSADLASLLQGLGLILKANLVWYDVSKSLHIYGYRYEFIPSMVHQNVLIFRKELCEDAQEQPDSCLLALQRPEDRRDVGIHNLFGAIPNNDERSSPVGTRGHTAGRSVAPPPDVSAEESII